MNQAERLGELRGKGADWGASVIAELREAEADPRSLMFTPLVLELIAVRT